MVPAAFVALEEIPRNANGKIDRRALPPPTESRDPSCEEERPPTHFEAKLAEIWCELLDLEHVGIGENFFDLGGDSLKAVCLLVTIEQRLGVELPLQVMVTAPTVEQLSHKVANACAKYAETTEIAAGVTGHVEPRTETERCLQGIWTSVLGQQPIGMADNFFKLHGNSVMFVQMLMEVRKRFGVPAEELPVNVVIQNPTIEALATMIDDCMEPSSSLIVNLQPKGFKRPLFLIHDGGGYVFSFRSLALRLGTDRPIYGVRAAMEHDGMEPPYDQSKSVEELAALYISEMKTVQPKGPYSIGGACFGGVIAFEIAQRLQLQGEKVKPLLLFDSYIANNPRIRDIAVNPFGSLRYRIGCHLSKASKLGPGKAVMYMSRKIMRNIPLKIGNTLLATKRLLRTGGSKIPSKSGWLPWQKDCVPIEEKHRRMMECYLEVPKRLLPRYKPSTYEDSVILFYSEQQSYDAELLWTGLAKGGLILHKMSCNHLGMVGEPEVLNTAALVREYLEQAESDEA